MAQEQERLAQWWDSLDDEQRNATRRAVSTGTLDTEAHRALQSGGLIDPSAAEGGPVPQEVVEHVKIRPEKMRHD